MRIDARSLLAAALVGCGIDAVGTLAGDGTTAVGPDGKPLDGSIGPNDDGSDGDGGPSSGDGGLDGEAGSAPLIYVSTLTELWSYAPLTKKWTFLKGFGSACTTVEELAVSGTGEIFAISWTDRALYKVDPQTYACAKVGEPGSGDFWSFAVSFVPKETFDAGVDTLVGYQSRDYIRIERDAGSSLITGNALDTGMTPSGDVISMGNRAFVSVGGSTGCITYNCLVEVNPRTGVVVKNWGPFPSADVYALGAWAGKIYGFRASGSVYEVTLDTPLGIINRPGPDGGISITGAGSSTLAPIQ